MAKKKYIETPEKMWQLFCAYRDKCKNNPIKVHDFVGKDGEEVYRERERPLTMEGFDLFCFDQGIIESIDHYFSNRDGRYSDYVGICTRIKQAIREDQISGGMAGIYNPSITQRLNGLVDKKEEDGKKEVVLKVKYEDGRTGNNPE